MQVEIFAFQGVWSKPPSADQKHKSREGSAGSAHALLGTIRSAIIEEHHNNLIVWMGMTSVWQGLHGQDQNSVASLLNTEIVEKLQGTNRKHWRLKLLEISVHNESIRSPEYPAFMGWRSLSTVCISTVSHKI